MTTPQVVSAKDRARQKRVAYLSSVRSRALSDLASPLEAQSALRSLGLSEGQAKWVSTLPKAIQQQIVPTPEALQQSEELGGNVDGAGLLHALAVQASVLVPGDWAEL